MKNYEKIKSSLIGALISGNSELIEKMTKFRISPLFFEACQRRAYIYSGNVEEYAKLAKDTQISEEGLISDIEFALLQKCYSIIAWIFTNKKFTKGLTGEMEKLFERVTEAGDAGLVLHISSLCKDEEIQWTYSHQALETIYSGSFPLIKLFAQKVAKQLPLYEMADPQHYVISSQLFENNRLK